MEPHETRHAEGVCGLCDGDSGRERKIDTLNPVDDPELFGEYIDRCDYSIAIPAS